MCRQTRGKPFSSSNTKSKATGEAEKTTDESHGRVLISSKKNITTSPLYQKDTFDFQGLGILFLLDQDAQREGTLQTRRVFRRKSSE